MPGPLRVRYQAPISRMVSFRMTHAARCHGSYFVARSTAATGGAIDYPTDVTVSLERGPPLATGDGGDGGAASASEDESQRDDNKNADTDGEDIITLNRSDRRSSAEVGEQGCGCKMPGPERLNEFSICTSSSNR